MTDIEFVSESTVSLVKHKASDLDVALAAWVSNNGENLPPDIKSTKWQLENVEVHPDGSLDEHYFYRHSEELQKDFKRIKGLINFLYRERHMSPFEHGSFTFMIDTPIFVAREFMRHRTFSYNETSGRYKELEPRFYLIPDERPVVQHGKVGAYNFTEGTPEQYGYTYASTTQSYANAWQAYQNMLNAGVAKEVARNVLPVGTMTQFYATCNPRNLMQFLLLRNDPNALYEIRAVAEVMEDYLKQTMPLTWAAFKQYDYRAEKAELEDLRKRVAQLEAFESYQDNIRETTARDIFIEMHGENPAAEDFLDRMKNVRTV